MLTKTSFVILWIVIATMTGYISKPDCPYYYSKLLKKNVYTSVHLEPEFPGGEAAYQRFLSRNLRVPQETIDADETNWPVMSNMKFIVDTDGQILNPVVHDKKDTTQLNAFEKEVLRIIRLMPKWNPGICHGKAVAAEVNRPMVICIRLETEE